MNLVESMGLEVTYAFDNLVFVEHNAFLLQMEETPEAVSLYFNQQSETASRPALTEAFAKRGLENGLTITRKGLFTIEAQEDQTLKITFLN
jgi:hypothetical protein